MHKGTNVDVAPLPLMSSKLHLPAIDSPKMPARRAEAASVEAEAEGLLSSALNKKLLVETCYSSTIFVHSRAGASLEAHHRMTSLQQLFSLKQHTCFCSSLVVVGGGAGGEGVRERERLD